MNKETAEQAYRKLIYFFENKIPIHFSLNSGIWQNGWILDLNQEKLTLVLREFEQGTRPILLEDINPESIVKFREKDDNIQKQVKGGQEK